MVDDKGNCNVDSFTVGREGYGNIFFPGTTNVAGLNLDEIVFIRHKEVIVYPVSILKRLNCVHRIFHLIDFSIG